MRTWFYKVAWQILMVAGCLSSLHLSYAKTDFADAVSKIDELDELNDRLLTLKRKTVASTYVTAEISNSLPSLRKDTQDLQITVTDLIARLPTTRRDVAHNLIEKYIQITKSLLILELYLDAKSVGMIQFRNQYALTVTLPNLSKLFPVGSTFIEGAEVTEFQSKDQGLVMLIHLSLEEIYRAMVRGAAQSPSMLISTGKQNPLSTQYLETTRCTLGRMIMGRYEIQKSLTSKAPLNSPVEPTTPVCLGSTAQDFTELTRSDAATFFEVFLRKKIAENMPRPEIDPKTLTPLQNSGLLEQWLYLYAFPDSLAALLNNTKPPLSDEELNNINTSATLAIKKFNDTHPDYASASHLWVEPELQDIFKKIMRDYNIKFLDTLQSPIATSELFNKMLEIEEFYFSYSLTGDFLSILPRLTLLNYEQNTIVFNDFINNEGKLAALAALNVMLAHFATDAAPSSEEILAKISEDFDTAIVAIQQRRSTAANIKALAAKLADLTEKLKTSAKQDYLLDFTNTLMKNAENVNNIMDETITPTPSLPYNAKAIIRTLNPMLSQLQEGNKERLEQLARATSFAEQKSIWIDFKSIIEKRAQTQNTSCEVTLSSQLKNWALSFYQEKQTSRAASAQRDCFIMNFLANTLAIGREKEPETMQNSSDFLKQKYSSSEHTIFFETYRQQLVGEIIAENRLLDMNVDPNTEANDVTAQKIYQRLVTNPDPQAHLQLIDQSLKRSLDSLSKDLRIGILAKKHEDLDYFITRTQVINSILGEDNAVNFSNKINGATAYQQQINNDHLADVIFAEGFNFPNLLSYHRNIQKQMTMGEDLTKEIWDEFVMDQGFMALAVVGGWAAKHAFGLFPQITGLPYVASQISSLGYKTSYLISGQMSYFMLTILANGGYLHLKKSEFNDQLLHNNDLLMADTIKFSTDESPLPLIQWDQYLNQKIYYKKAYDTAVSERNMALVWAALPLVTAAAFKTAVPILEKMKRAKNVKFELLSAKDRWLYEGRLKIKFRQRRILLAKEFKLINDPKITSADTLSVGKDVALLRATSESEKLRIHQAYERIIITYGGDLASIARYPQLLESYTRSLVGPHGTSSQLTGIIKEYQRLLSAKSNGVL